MGTGNGSAALEKHLAVFYKAKCETVTWHSDCTRGHLSQRYTRLFSCKICTRLFLEIIQPKTGISPAVFQQVNGSTVRSHGTLFRNEKEGTVDICDNLKRYSGYHTLKEKKCSK